MPLILCIDTAVQYASVCIADGIFVVAETANPLQMESASWLHQAIADLMNQTGYQVSAMQAIAVTSGPGSYTGLRVGMAAAKGICYAANIPLITINTLQMMAAAAVPAAQLLAPMIDARRMEVFTALYDHALNQIMPATAMILDANSFADWLEKTTICFFGNGSNKAATVIKNPNAVFIPVAPKAAHMARLAAQMFELNQFSNVAYTEPFYGKEFYLPIPKNIY